MGYLFAGIDSSTQGTKLLVLNMETQKVIYTDSVNYDKDLPQYDTRNGVIQTDKAGVSESNPNMWVDALHMLFERLRKSDVEQQRIKCISVSGQQHGLVTLDKDGNLTRPTSKLWNDFSTQKECDIMTEKTGGVDAMIKEVGNSQRTGYTAAKIFHMARHEPEAFEKTCTCFLVHNYINWFLTGGRNGGVRVMEPGDTSGMALWHPGTQTWSKKVMGIISPDLEQKLPPLKAADKSIGAISQDLVEHYKFDPSCKIDAGCGDNMYGAVGTGNVAPGIVTLSLGTSGTAYTCLSEPYIDRKGEIAAFCDSTGNHLPLLCVSNLANGYNQVLEQYKLSHQDFVKRVQNVPVGNKGRILIPWYMGERTPDMPNATPVYFGFGLDDFQPDILCRAVLEGHILNLYEGFRDMPVKPREIRLTGGLSQSKAWVQTIADIFETEAVPVEGEGAALGAALHAAWVWKKEAGERVDLKDLVQPFVVLQEDRRCKPDPDHVNIHNQQKQLFSALSKRARGLSADDPFALSKSMS
ncbi:MAG: FGGY family carbohydrate kinase [candidate division KSB1 bacterium]|nr:FGGY family carbohydrate kinase [candidate division KSB1 bacterium]